VYKNTTITIFTPTYNRAYILKRCYESLKKQTHKKFTWLIVDDGSSDDTEEIINEWMREEKINIKYYKKSNGGKSSAHNLGVKKTETELFVCVDSDDYITDNAIEEILKFWNNCKDNSIAGIVALKGHNSNKPLKTYMPVDKKKLKLFNLYNKHGFQGDAMLIYKTAILKKNLFPEIDGEKFVPEAYVYDQIDRNYDLILLNKVLYICDYLDDGYTKNFKKVIVQNPKGYAKFYAQRMEICDTFYLKFRSATLYVLGNLIAKNRNFIKCSPKKLLTIIAIPSAITIFIFKYRFGKI